MQGKLSPTSEEEAIPSPAGIAQRTLDGMPGGVFQLLRAVDGRWSFPFVGRDLPGFFLQSAADLAADARIAADHVAAEDVETLRHHLRHSRETGQPLKTRFRMRLPGSPEIFLEAHATPTLSFSGGTLWSGFLVDATADQRINRELRHLHRRWSFAARAAGVGVLQFDPASGCLSFDTIACAHHGILAEHAALALPDWLARVAPEDRAAAEAALRAMPLDGFAERLVLRMGGADAPRTLEFVLQVVTGEDYLVGTCRDITQQLNVESLQRDKLVAEQANRSKGEFMSRVSHELRTPLNGILGFVQLMTLDREYPLPPVHMRRLDVLRQSGTRLLTLIDQLLDVARLDEGGLALQLGPVDVQAIVEQSVAAAHAKAHARGIEVAVEVAPSAPVLADPAALQRVLDALMSNAIKYNRPQGRIRVRFETGGAIGRLTVDDTGAGMSREQLARLFEPFNRLGAERSGVDGSGLGLVIARQLVRAMAGDLEVHSLAGRGSRFQVALPLAERAEGAPAPADSAAPASAMPSEWHGLGPRTVLYIEDDEVNTLLMEQVFVSQPAWRLVTAATGAEGLRAAQEQQPAAILLDLHLPDMSGLDVLEQLRADPSTRDIRCIAVSADVLPDRIATALERGFDAYWTKPLDLVRVVGDLKRLFNAGDAAVDA
jgi:signal transduction histidine kinase/ActR/RegA family two-component response regulator